MDPSHERQEVRAVCYVGVGLARLGRGELVDRTKLLERVQALGHLCERVRVGRGQRALCHEARACHRAAEVLGAPPRARGKGARLGEGEGRSQGQD